MSIGIGIDTGGTYTDAVVYDFEERAVLAKAKALTTKEDLSLGIGRALDALPRDLAGRARVIALSTTLATNACVEHKGGRAKLILMGASREVLDWIGADSAFGLRHEEVLCLDTKGSFDGSVVDEPDWAELVEREDRWLSDAQALSLVEIHALKNGAVCERNGRDALAGRYGVPIVIASELAAGLNVMERGATALLNARLLPVIEEFMGAVGRAMRERGLSVPAMMVRSDGSLMVDELSRLRPVETILSGPASSAMGGLGLSGRRDCLIVDMGGTTTDISIVEGGSPAMTGGIRIGSWKTQVKGVFIDTFGLGGDSRLHITHDRLSLSERRVQPLCVAAAEHPRIKAQMLERLDAKGPHAYPGQEFLYLVRRPSDPSRYTKTELALLETLEGGPQMIKTDGLAFRRSAASRLEDEGLVMRCGLTPTDIMHIRGDFDRYDGEASRIGARFFLNALPGRTDDEAGMAAFCAEVYDLVQGKLYENILRLLLAKEYPEHFSSGLGDQARLLVARRWAERDAPAGKSFLAFDFKTPAALVGIGAPTHLFLPEVARALGTECVIPPHSEVANAVGAVIADISVRRTAEVVPIYTAAGVSGYTVYAEGGGGSFESLEEALEAAKSAAAAAAEAEGRRRGAAGKLSVALELRPQVARAKDGLELDLGTEVVAVASGRAAL